MDEVAHVPVETPLQRCSFRALPDCSAFNRHVAASLRTHHVSCLMRAEMPQMPASAADNPDGITAVTIAHAHCRRHSQPAHLELPPARARRVLAHTSSSSVFTQGAGGANCCGHSGQE